MNEIINGMLSRLPAESKTERDLVAAALQIPVNFKAKADVVLGDADLSPDGKTRRIQELAKGDALAHLRQLRAQAKAMASETSNLRQAMQVKEPDRADLTAEMRRAELRTFIRGLPQGERLRFVVDNEAATIAALDALPEMSGLNAEIFDRVKAAHVERLHGPQLAGLAAREEVVAVVNSAVAIATREFLQVSGLTEGEIAA